MAPKLVRSGSLLKGRPAPLLSSLLFLMRLRAWHSTQMAMPARAKAATQPMTMPAMAPLEAEAFLEGDEEEVGVEVVMLMLVAAAVKEETLKLCGMGSPGLRPRVAAAAARFWRESWEGSAWWVEVVSCG